jgi:hypothetical protein
LVAAQSPVAVWCASPVQAWDRRESVNKSRAAESSASLAPAKAPNEYVTDLITARRRAQWARYQDRIEPEHLVFIDETWTRTNMAPLRVLGTANVFRLLLGQFTAATHWRCRNLRTRLLAHWNSHRSRRAGRDQAAGQAKISTWRASRNPHPCAPPPRQQGHFCSLASSGTSPPSERRVIAPFAPAAPATTVASSS